MCGPLFFADAAVKNRGSTAETAKFRCGSVCAQNFTATLGTGEYGNIEIAALIRVLCFGDVIRVVGGQAICTF